MAGGIARPSSSSNSDHRLKEGLFRWVSMVPKSASSPPAGPCFMSSPGLRQRPNQVPSGPAHGLGFASAPAVAPRGCWAVGKVCLLCKVKKWFLHLPNNVWASPGPHRGVLARVAQKNRVLQERTRVGPLSRPHRLGTERSSQREACFQSHVLSHKSQLSSAPPLRIRPLTAPRDDPCPPGFIHGTSPGTGGEGRGASAPSQISKVRLAQSSPSNLPQTPRCRTQV